MNSSILKTKIHLCFKSFSLFTILLCNITSIAQSNFKTTLDNLNILDKKQTEKVYLHLDRTIFSPGEDIWFKAYLLEGTYHTLTSTTNNLHVELIAPNGDIKTSQVILINEGSGYGDIKLPYEGFKDGVYELRAYTNFMRNFNYALFFKQNIIITGNKEVKKNKQNSVDIVDLQFFPEGGQLVYNVLNRVAFKAIDQNGKGKNISFTILDDQNNEIQKTETVHNGMGQFMFTPKPNTTYHATLQLPGSESQKVDLPKASSAYSIFVGNQFKNLLDFNICTSPENVNGQQVSYIIQSRGKLYSSNSFKMNAANKSVRIEKKELPSGISSITLYDENEIPVCERLIYNQIAPKVQVVINANKKSYNTREKVTLRIETRNEDGKPIPANLSLAVIGKHISDKQKEMLPDNSTILSSVLLRSDLKGHIENPDFYFENFDKKKHYYLDLVLLTHGWSKYVWKEKVNTDNFAMEYAYEKGFTFTGIAKTLALKRPIPNSKVSLVMSDEGFYYDEVIADEKGRFAFNNVHFMDTSQIVFQAYNKKDKRNSVIEIDPYYYKSPKSGPVKAAVLFQKNKSLDSIAIKSEKIVYLKDSIYSKNHRKIEEIIVKGRKKDDHFRLYGRASQVVEITDELAELNTLASVIKKEIHGAHVYGVCPFLKVTIRGVRGIHNSSTVKYLLDGMFVGVEHICTIHPSLIDKIEVLSGANTIVFGTDGKAPIIAVYLKKSGARWAYVPVGIIKVKPQGYYRSREFYAPNYEVAQEQFEGADYRNTIHWEPFISTGKDGKAELSFFNSDDPGNYNITIEGLGLNGGLGKSEINYSVHPDNFSNR